MMLRNKILVMFFYFISIGPLHALGVVEFGPQNTMMNGSVKYSVVGKYKAKFSRFHGTITLDQETQRITAVVLKIDAASIESNCLWCDKVVRSGQLLSVGQYPDIVFESTSIIQDKKEYIVEGMLDMHGVQKKVRFSFNATVLKDSKTFKGFGQWIIRRKDFNITWNKILDHGGILVGDHIIVDWKIESEIKNKEMI